MIGPDGYAGFSTPTNVTMVKATDRTVNVELGNDFTGPDMFRVNLWLSLDEDAPEPVEISWKGVRGHVAAAEQIRFAHEFSDVLGDAITIAEELQRIATDHGSVWWEGWDKPDPDIARSIMAGRSDWVLCAYLILNGFAAFYARGREKSDEAKGRGVHDLQGLRDAATQLVLTKVKI